MCSNLPDWPGADICYSRAYRLLECMAKKGHATPAQTNRRGRAVFAGYVSDDMKSALDSGDEESIKGMMIHAPRMYGIPMESYL